MRPIATHAFPSPRAARTGITAAVTVVVLADCASGKMIGAAAPSVPAPAVASNVPASAPTSSSPASVATSGAALVAARSSGQVRRMNC